jgi:glyoxylase-like metal-dependent hydrolase (beta-lactamase superfamily II)
MHYEDGEVEVHKLVVGPVDNNVFILRCKRTGDAVLIDAANEADRVLSLAGRLGVSQVLQTHGHWDHVQAVPAVREAGLPVGVGGPDAPMLPGHDFTLEDGLVTEAGRLRLRAMSTPGHTPGSMCFLVEGAPLLFSGDTLFPGGPGKTTTEQEFATIIRSIEDRLFSALEPETIVMPGHGPDTTIGAERPSLDEWVERGW